MLRTPRVTMTMRELDRLKCIQGLVDGELKQHAVATRLGLTARQVRRLVRRYERQIYLIEDTPSNRRYIGKFIEVFQFPDGRIEIRVAGVSLPYSTYNKIGIIDQGAIVDNKRLSQVLRTAQIVQAQRDDRVVGRPSTAHRADGTPIPKNKIAGTKRQRELTVDDLHTAINNPRLGQKPRKEVTC